jgi:hypothetical protein
MCNRDTPRYLASLQAMDDLRQLNAVFIENFVRNDVAAHDALLHPDFLYVGASGQRVDRASYLKNWATALIAFSTRGGDIGMWFRRTPKRSTSRWQWPPSGGTIEVSPTPRTP